MIVPIVPVKQPSWVNLPHEYIKIRWYNNKTMSNKTVHIFRGIYVVVVRASVKKITIKNVEQVNDDAIKVHVQAVWLP